MISLYLFGLSSLNQRMKLWNPFKNLQRLQEIRKIQKLNSLEVIMVGSFKTSLFKTFVKITTTKWCSWKEK